jgi:hypothetical protein
MAEYDNQKLQALAQELMSDDVSLVTEVELALHSPHDYIQHYSERLSHRGIDQPCPGLPWIALVDGLSARGRLVEIDWKEPPVGVLEALDELLGQDPNRWGSGTREKMEETSADALDTLEYLEKVADHLKHRDVALAFIDIQSDCFPLLIIDLKSFEYVRQLATATGYGEICPLWSRPARRSSSPRSEFMRVGWDLLQLLPRLLGRR